VSRRACGALIVLVGAAWALGASAPPGDHKPSELIGTWRGTSTCTDRVAAPACHDEVVVYDFTAGEKPGSVHWKADKVVEGQRLPMGEMDLVYDAAERCWMAEFSSARVHSVWCLVVDGAHLTGTARLLPGKQTVRRIDARKDGAGGA
jgi:hypothetical protein